MSQFQKGDRVSLESVVWDIGKPRDRSRGQCSMEPKAPLQGNPSACWHGICIATRIFADAGVLVENAYGHVRRIEPADLVTRY